MGLGGSASDGDGLPGCCAGCRQEMADQPSLRPLEGSPIFANGQSARPLVEGTVPRPPVPGTPIDGVAVRRLSW